MNWKLILSIAGSLFAAIMLTIFVATILFKSNSLAEAESLFAASTSPADTSLITESDLLQLPEPVRRMMRYSRVIGKPRARFVRLQQYGAMRPKRGGPWMPLEAEQYYTIDPPGFVWIAKVSQNPLMYFSGRDKFVDGKGNMHIKVYSLFSVVDAVGPELDQGAMLRYVSEIPWFPTAFLSPYLSWEAIDSTSAKVTMTWKDRSVSAILHIDHEGKLIDFTCERFMFTDTGYELNTWVTPTIAYADIGGYAIPSKGEAIWRLPAGDLSYIRLDSLSIQYDVARDFE